LPHRFSPRLRPVYPMLPVSLDYPFLIAPSLFSSSSPGAKTRRKAMGQSRMGNPETLATLGTRGEDEQRKNYNTES
jgi:hypothetical protein